MRVNILSFNSEVPDTDNGKTLADIALSNFEFLEVRKKYQLKAKEVPSVDNKSPENELMQKVHF
jgi:hypothetical protein